MKENNRYYVLSYAYDIEDDNYKCIQRGAYIAIFSSEEKANNAIDFMMNQPGFKDHPRECFCIDYYDLNKLQEWTTGFTKFYY